MNFNSVEFSAFFVCVLVLYTVVFYRERWRDVLLLAASYFFYMSWNWKYAGLLAFSTIVDYSVGLVLARERRPRARTYILIISLTSNLGLLALFKYYNFFIELSGPAIAMFGWDLSLLRHELLLPVGISFYTFQTMSYTIDVYRGERVLERNFLKFAVFVAFFPQLIAGPIVRAKQFLPQLHHLPNVTTQRFHDGLFLVFKGLSKKVLIADLLATLAVDNVFTHPLTFSSWDLLIGLYAYTFQIYYDFSGYSDIAIGLAKMLGYDLPQNFNRPYLSQNVREFWTRWHISLSTWLRDYLYISLGGSRAAPWRVKMNLMITMFLGGLWHGAALHFICWGVYHGLLLILAGQGPKTEAVRTAAQKVLLQIGCFHLIAFGWLLFRVQDLDNFLDFIRGWSHLTGGTRLSGVFYIILSLGILFHVFPAQRLERFAQWWIMRPVPIQAATYGTLLLIYAGMTLEAPSFIYFQF